MTLALFFCISKMMSSFRFLRKKFATRLICQILNSSEKNSSKVMIISFWLLVIYRQLKPASYNNGKRASQLIIHQPIKIQKLVSKITFHQVFLTRIVCSSRYPMQCCYLCLSHTRFFVLRTRFKLANSD